LNRIRNFLQWVRGRLTGPQWRRLLIAFVIALIGLGLRMHLALTGPVEWDEPVYLDAAVLYAQDIRGGNWNELLNSDYNYEHPLLNKLAYGSILALYKPAASLNSGIMPAGSEFLGSPFYARELSLRLFSVAFGSAAVFLLSLVNPLAGLFLAVNTYAIKYTSVIYLEALPMCLTLLSVLAFVKSQPPGPTGEEAGRTSLVWLAASGVLLGLAVASKYMYGLTGLAMLVYALIHGRKHPVRLIRILLIWGALAALFFFLGDPVLWANPIARLTHSLNFSVDYAQNSTTVMEMNYPFWQPLDWLAIAIPRHSLSTLPFFVGNGNFLLAIDGFFLPFALLGLRRMAKSHSVFLGWLLLGLAFLLVWNTKWPQYILTILVPYSLSAALGVEVAIQTLKNAFSRSRAPLTP
jgi:hypothetical protein